MTFVAVADAGSFRAGAEAVNMSQSAVSVRIQNLERRLGVPLFHRTTRSVQLTVQGERLLAVARGILNDFERIAQDLRSEAELEKGRVSVGAMPSVAARILPMIMSEFRKKYPGIEVIIRDIDSGRMMNMLKGAELDVALISECDPEQFEFTPLFWDPFFIVFSQAVGSRLPQNVSLADIAPMPLLLSAKETTIRQKIEELLRSADLSVNVVHEAYNTATLIGLAEQGFGVAIVPGVSLANARTDGCEVRRLTPDVGRNVGLAISRHRSISPAQAAFQKFLEKHIAKTASALAVEFD